MTGFKSPNWTAVPNDFFEMMWEMSRAEYLVTMVAFRQILGFHKQAPEPISISQFVERTRLNRTSVVKGIKEAVKRGTLKKYDGNYMTTARYEIVFSDEPSAEIGLDPSAKNVPATSAEIGLDPSTEIVPTKERVVKEKQTTTPPATRKPVQDEKQKAPVTTEPVKEPKKQPVNEVAEAIKQKFAIYANNFQIAHIIQGTYKATSSKSRQSDRTATWVSLAEKFAQRPATVADIEAFAAWYRSKCSYNMKSTDTFLNYYGEWFDMRKAQVAAQPALRMYKGELDPYGIIEALDRERMEKAAAQEKSA